MSTCPGCGAEHAEPFRYCGSCRLAKRVETRKYRAPKRLRPCGCGWRGAHRIECQAAAPAPVVTLSPLVSTPTGAEFARARLRRAS